MRDNTRRLASPPRSRPKWPAALLALAVLTTGTASTVQAAEARDRISVNASATASAPLDARGVQDELKRLEATHHVRIGAYALDTVTGRTLSYRGNESFPSLSTFKAMECAAVLDRARRSEPGLLDKVVHWKQSDEVRNSPVTAGQGRSG